MPLEDAQYIAELNKLWPLGTDGLNQSDDHHRVIKQATQQSFPNIDAEVTASAADLNTLTGAAGDGSPYGLNPVGTIIMGAWASAPNGYLPCDGALIDAKYSDLIAIVGANAPDLRGQFVRGWSGDALIDPDGPRAPLSLQDDELAAHTHPGFANRTGGANGVQDMAVAADDFWEINQPAGGPETRPKNMAVFYAIKW